MPIELHIQTITGRIECDEPSTAKKLDCEDFTYRELNQFYIQLKSVVRHIEKIIDEEEAKE